MTRSPTATENDVVDLLVTWGATAQPGMTELFDALVRKGKPEGLDLVRQVLETPGVSLDPTLRDELLGILERASKDPFDPTLERRLPRMLNTAERALRESARERSESLRREIEPWARLLSSNELEKMWDLLWRSGAAEDLPARLVAAGGLEHAGGILDGAKARVEREVRDLLDSASPSTLDSETRALAGRALESRDPASLAEALVKLRIETKEKDRKETEEKTAAARERLSGLCASVRAAAESPERDMDPGSRDLALSAVTASERLLALETSSSLLRSLGRWEQTLTTILDSTVAADAVGRDRRERLVLTLAKELAAANDGTEIGKRLRDKATAGGRAFDQAVLAATGTLATRKQEFDAKAESSAGRLRDSAKKLSSALEKSAALLPTEHVVRSRLLLEQAEATAAGREPTAMESMAAAIEEEIDRIHQVAKLTKKSRGSREEAERQRLRGEATRLLDVAAGRDARRLRAFIDGLPDLEGGRALEAAREELHAIRARVGNAVRLECTRTLRNAEKRLKRKGGDADLTLNDTVEELRTAFEEDDLSAMAPLSDEVSGKLKGAFGGPVVRITLAVAAVVIVAGALFAWWQISDPRRTYELTLETAEDVDSVTVTLMRDGQVVDGPHPVAGRSLKVSLEPGRYEIYVNQRYTGRVFRVPEDGSPLEGIPVPR